MLCISVLVKSRVLLLGCQSNNVKTDLCLKLFVMTCWVTSVPVHVLMRELAVGVTSMFCCRYESAERPIMDQTTSQTCWATVSLSNKCRWRHWSLLRTLPAVSITQVRLLPLFPSPFPSPSLSPLVFLSPSLSVCLPISLSSSLSLPYLLSISLPPSSPPPSLSLPFSPSLSQSCDTHLGFK